MRTPSKRSSSLSISDHGEEVVKYARNYKTALVEPVRKLEQKYWFTRSEVVSLQQMLEDVSSTRFDRKQKKRGYIWSALDVKHIGTASEILSSVAKLFSN